MAAPYDLQISNVKVTLPQGRTLFSIREMRIPFGSHILIQGHSGCGKTTFLHLLAGLFSPPEGDVLLGDKRLKNLSDNERCDLRKNTLGIIFQKLNVIDHLTVAENISLSLQKSSDESSQVLSALDRVNLKGREHERCSYLSLGEQQRVAVARVLAQAPHIILADEPTSSLDDENTKFVVEALKEMSQGKTLIVVSHDHRISKYFETVIRMEDHL